MSDFYTSLMDEWGRVKNKVNFGRILAHYRVLVKEKTSLALCPFHDDHNPSMHISEIQGLYHCFSCGASGDIINFIRNKEQCDFVTAVRIACDICGIPLFLKERQEYKTANQDLYDLNKAAADYFHLRLLENTLMLKILNKRNITTDHIIRHKLGYAADIAKFEEHHNNIESLCKIGLINKKNKLIFTNRIIFPIILTTGHVVGFAGRKIYKYQNIKYLNTHENEIFEKRNLVYNMQHLSALPNKPIYIVEGYFDAIKLQGLGYRVVALMGTQMSKYIFNILCQYSNDLVLALDQDQAGREATNNIIEKTILPCLSPKTNIYVAIYRYKDPDEAADANKFNHLPIPLTTYYQYHCEQNHNNNSKALRAYYKISHLIINSEARNNFYSQWERDFSTKQKTFDLIRSFQSNTYLKDDLKRKKYLQYYKCVKTFPNILLNLKLQYSHPLIVDELSKIHRKAEAIFNADSNLLLEENEELKDYEYYYDLTIDLAVENCLEALKEKSKNKLTAEEALEIFNMTMEIINIRKS